MLCFDVALNGKRVSRAGVPGYGVLTTILTWVRRDPRKRPADLPKPLWKREELDFHVGGMSGAEHLVWLERRVRRGDVIRIRIVDRPSAERTRRLTTTTRRAKSRGRPGPRKPGG